MLDLNKIKAKFDDFFNETSEETFHSIIQANRRKEREQQLFNFLLSWHKHNLSRSLLKKGLESHIEICSTGTFNEPSNAVLNSRFKLSGSPEYAMAA